MYKRILRKRIVKGLVISLALFAVIPISNAAAKPVSLVAKDSQVNQVSPSEISTGLGNTNTETFGVTGPERRAMILRGEALNKKYGLGQYVFGPTKQELAAMNARGEAMNKTYHLGQYAVQSPEITAGLTSQPDSWLQSLVLNQKYSTADLKADIARGQSMNQRHQLGQYSVSAEFATGLTSQPDSWLQSLVLNQKYSTADLKADIARGQSMNQRHQLGQYSVSAEFATPSQPQTVAASTGSDFQWNDAWIGAGILAALLLGVAATLAVRSRHQGGFAH